MKIKAGDLVKLKDSDEVWMADDFMGNKASVYSFINITNSLYRTLCKKEDIIEVKRPVKYETIYKCKESTLEEKEIKEQNEIMEYFLNSDLDHAELVLGAIIYKLAWKHKIEYKEILDVIERYKVPLVEDMERKEEVKKGTNEEDN